MKSEFIRLLAIPILLGSGGGVYAEDVRSPIDIPLSVTHGSATPTATFTGDFSSNSHQLENVYGTDQTVSGSATLDVPSSGTMNGCGIFVEAKDHGGAPIGEYALGRSGSTATIGYTVSVSGSHSWVGQHDPFAFHDMNLDSGVVYALPVANKCRVDISALKIKLLQPSFTPEAGAIYSGYVVLRGSHW